MPRCGFTVATGILLALLLSLAACGTPTGSASPTATPKQTAEAPQSGGALVLADISNSPSKTIERFQPLADYLAEHLREAGVKAGEVKVAPDLLTMSSWMQRGQVDIYFDSPYPAMIISELSNAQPVLRRWKGGTSDYSSVIFARTDSGIAALTDLKGHLLALEENYSTSGYFLPIAHLLEAGLNPVKKSTATDPVASAEVGYIFTGSEENTVQWVLSGKVDAGAVDSETFKQIPKEARAQLTILQETESVARHVMLVRHDLDPQLLKEVTAVLLKMDETPEGQAVLQLFEETKQFDEIPVESSLSRMRQLYDLVAKSQGTPALRTQ